MTNNNPFSANSPTRSLNSLDPSARPPHVTFAGRAKRAAAGALFVATVASGMFGAARIANISPAMFIGQQATSSLSATGATAVVPRPWGCGGLPLPCDPQSH